MSLKVHDTKTYFGGKSGAGTYQGLINRIPPHDVFASLFLGNCGITRNIKPATLNILNDLDTRVVASWKNAIGDDQRYRVLNEDAIELLRSTIAEMYDTAGVFIYLDPPYRFVTRKGQKPAYRHELSDNQHLELLQRAKALKHARLMISHYPNDMYDELLAGWNTYDYYSTTHGGYLALERIYCNYQFTDQLHDYSYIGDDFREREALSRQKKNFMKKLKRLDPLLRNAILSDLASQKNAIPAGLDVDVASIAFLSDDTR